MKITVSVTMLMILFVLMLVMVGLGACGKILVPPDAVTRDVLPKPAFDPQSKRVPPVVESASIKRLDAPTDQGNAVLMVKFRERQRRTAVVIQPASERIALRDDGKNGDERAGDGLFSAVVSFDFDQAATRQRRFIESAKTHPSVPVFEQRRLVGQRMIRLEEIQALERKPIFDLPPPLGFPSAVDPVRELVITDPSVVEDSTRTFDPCTESGTRMGTWTFGHLMTEMANQAETGIDPSDFVRRWLHRWEIDQTINDFPVAARPSITNLLINPWPRIPGTTKLDLAEAPFRLLAIVNRIDLRENVLYGGGSAGEARFVFGALNRNSCGSVPQFTVILEYGIKKASCPLLHAWAEQWHNLGSLPLGSPAYNSALEAITTQFTEAGADPAKLPNKSALNQLRTNEIALASPWELREFRIFDSDSDAGHLREVTVKQTPDIGRNNQPVIRDYINANEADILVSKHVVPIEFPPGAAFLGGSSLTPLGMFWNGPATINSLDARRLFSFNTCNGCHARETQICSTPANCFTHVKPRPAGSSAGLSGFMTGIDLSDPVVSTTVSHFDELTRRAQDLDALVSSSCLLFPELFHRPLLMVH